MNNLVNSLVAIAIIIAIVVGGIFGAFWIWTQMRVMSAESLGKAEYARAEQNRMIKVKTAEAERDAAKLQAEAITIMGQAAQQYPEYRQQEFMSAFGEALREGNISQIIYVPTEANIPVLESGKRQ